MVKIVQLKAAPKRLRRNKSNSRAIVRLERGLASMQLAGVRNTNKASRRRLRRGRGVGSSVTDGITALGRNVFIPPTGPIYTSDPNTGDMILSYEEQWGEAIVKGSSAPVPGALVLDGSGNNFLVFWPGQSGMARLDTFGNLYEQYVVEMCEVTYRSASGATNNGQFNFGIDYDPRDTPATNAGVQTLVPRAVVPVWQSIGLRPSVDRVMKAKYLYTAAGDTGADTMTGGFALCGASGVGPQTNDVLYGTIWCKYRVRFVGPVNVNQQISIVDMGEVQQAGGAWTGISPSIVSRAAAVEQGNSINPANPSQWIVGSDLVSLWRALQLAPGGQFGQRTGTYVAQLGLNPIGSAQAPLTDFIDLVDPTGNPLDKSVAFVDSTFQQQVGNQLMTYVLIHILKPIASTVNCFLRYHFSQFPNVGTVGYAHTLVGRSTYQQHQMNI